MKKVIPYKRSTGALKALDNGGRFYNLLTRAKDDEIEPGELARVAGVFNNRQMMFLFLEMAIHDLSDREKEDVKTRLSDKLRAERDRHVPQVLLPSEADEQGEASRTAIITGFPRFVEDKTVFTGFIYVPIQVGKVTTLMLIPMMDHFDVYELTDEVSSKTVFVAHVRGSPRLPSERTRFGGILKETKRDKEGKNEGGLYLQAAYYTPLTALPGAG